MKMAEQEIIMKKRGNFPGGMVLTVLLVETDDSTRRIIAALLRKCSYRVAAVSDGLMAWEALKRGPYNIDLILTEVDLPSISGYALLTLIMEHEVCKNIPVIMMSSQDSISVVLKCMLKGAADFLIKPVRKNELRNLWQHVWRKKFTALNTSDAEHKEEATIKNSSASDQLSDHLASTRKRNACSEKEIEAQSSCTMPYMEAESAIMPIMQHVSQIKSGNASDKSYIKGQEENLKLVEKSDIVIDVSEGIWPMSHTENDGNICEINCHADENIKPSIEAIDLIGKFENHLKDVNRQSNTDSDAEKIGIAPQLELSLRRSYASCLQDEETEEWHRLNHSNVSAFLRYDNSKPLKPFLPAYTGTCTELKETASCNSALLGASGIDGQEAKDPLMSSSYSAKAEAALLHTQFGFTPVASVSFDNLCAGLGMVLSPFHHPPLGASMTWNAKLAGQQEQIPSSLSNSIQSNSEIHKSGQNYCACNEATSHPIGRIVEEDKNVESRESSRNGSPAPCLSNSEGCSSICNTVNGDANLPAAVSGASVTESINENHGIVHDGPRGIDSHHHTQREAAILKFRLKRKERSYEKKVRYESRKRIAEQRPRVKGQFVRKSLMET